VFRIRRIHDDNIPIDKEAIAHVQNILRTQFSEISEKEISKLPEQLRNPLKYRFRSTILVADDLRGRVKGFAFFFYMSDLNFCYLDFVSTAQKSMGRGIGGALYERVREEALSLNTIGLFLECLPDDPALCKNPDVLKQNIARLRFYERYGARPITNTAYETPVKPEDDCPPYLVYDDLGTGRKLSSETARKVVRAILERKYGSYCPRDYTTMVVESFKDDPVLLREPRYVKKEAPIPAKLSHSTEKSIALVVNDRHQIHHVRERGYVESPVRIDSILKEILPTGLFQAMEPRRFSMDHIKAVHEPRFVEYLKTVCMNIEPQKSVYPYVFPIRNVARPPKELPIRAGYYCIDTFTPLNRNAYLAARRAVDCALTAVDAILKGHRFAYALVRPPGHHAERHSFGGFCYFNSAAVAAHFMSTYGKIAVLDVDYHHGNGTQDIFYDRSDILTVSIHGHPRMAYPYFSGFDDEKGVGLGTGYNVNIPLPEHVDGNRYRDVLDHALRQVKRFQPNFLIVALGLDTAKGDPTGTWSLQPRDFESNGRMIGAIGLPILVVQEGGYRTRSLGINARHFFTGLLSGFQQTKALKASKRPPGTAA
jgi:acetoin utilization deacetylase AcuC-like enzyme/GNAT superfamily N-acetyltransferase